jgi:DNA polymerase-3 subunit epsilon
MNHKLETVYKHLFGKLPEDVRQHRALDDARMAARVWVELGGLSG